MMKQLSDFVANALAHIFGVSLNDCRWVTKKAKYYRDNYSRFDYSTCSSLAVNDWFYTFTKPFNVKKATFLYNVAYNALMM